MVLTGLESKINNKKTPLHPVALFYTLHNWRMSQKVSEDHVHFISPQPSPQSNNHAEFLIFYTRINRRSAPGKSHIVKLQKTCFWPPNPGKKKYVLDFSPLEQYLDPRMLIKWAECMHVQTKRATCPRRCAIGTNLALSFIAD